MLSPSLASFLKAYEALVASGAIEPDAAQRELAEAFSDLEAPIKTVTAPHTPVPFSPALEDIYVPTPAKIRDAVLAVRGHA